LRYRTEPSISWRPRRLYLRAAMVQGAPKSWDQYGTLLEQHLEAGAAKGAYIVKQPFNPRMRMKMNVVAIFVSLFLPWLLFSLLFADVSFRIHYKMPELCWGLVLLGVLLVLWIGFLAGLNIQEMMKGAPSYKPTWYIFLFLTSLVAVVLGPVLGNWNFWQNMQPYYDLMNLNTYTSVDPMRMRGQQMMDAGRIEFLEGAAIDVTKAYAFQNLDTYCVAPITIQGAAGTLLPLASYDFWAVGLGCCSGNAADFHCGEYNNPKAHSGLRLLRDDQRAFFRLAVQQAESSYGIKATHPLFFYWSEDNEAEMNVFRDEGYKYFLIGMLAHFAWQLLSVTLAVAGFARLGQI